MRTDRLEPGRTMAVERSAAKTRRTQVVKHSDLPIVGVIEVWQSLHDLEPIPSGRHQGKAREFLHNTVRTELESLADQIAQERTYCKGVDLRDGRTNARIVGI